MVQNLHLKKISKKICDSLLEKTDNKALCNKLQEDITSFIVFREVIEAMIPILENSGYHSFNPKIVEYFRPSILEIKNFGDSADKI